MRIVSLVPSVTETLLGWGIEPVACTRFCEQPSITHVGGTKNPDLAAIEQLAPDLVVMEREENRLEDYESLVARGIEVLDLSVRSLQDVDPAMRHLAARAGASWETPDLGEVAEPRLRAFVPIWRRPYMALGCPTYGASLLGALGVANVMADDGPYPAVTLEQMSALHPDVVLAPNEPYPFAARHVPELQAVAPCVLIDGQDLFWWGIRTAGAHQRLGQLIATL